VAILVDQPIGGPRKIVLDRVVGEERESTNTNINTLDFLKVTNKIGGNNAYGPRCQAALRDKYIVALEGFDVLGRFTVFGEIEVGDAEFGSYRGDVLYQIVGSCTKNDFKTLGEPILEGLMSAGINGHFPR